MRIWRSITSNFIMLKGRRTLSWQL